MFCEPCSKTVQLLSSDGHRDSVDVSEAKSLSPSYTGILHTSPTPLAPNKRNEPCFHNLGILIVIIRSRLLRIADLSSFRQLQRPSETTRAAFVHVLPHKVKSHIKRPDSYPRAPE